MAAGGMSSSLTSGDDAGAAFCTSVDDAFRHGTPEAVSDESLQRVLSAVLTALTELELTLAEARLLFDPDDRDGIRRWAIASVANQEAREELEWLHEIACEPRGRSSLTSCRLGYPLEP